MIAFLKKIVIPIYIYLYGFIEYLTREFLCYIPSHSFRRIIAKIICKKVGSETYFLRGVEFRRGKNITIGPNCAINKNVLLDGRGGILEIGKNVDIAQETNIWTLQHDVHSDYHKEKGGEVIIEDYVWIASRVTILPGVRIGKGAVVASNSVVTKDVEKLSIVAGVPAKKIGERKSKLKYKIKYKPPFDSYL